MYVCHNVCMYVCMCVYVCMYVHVCMYVCTCMCMLCVCICVYTCMYVRTYVRMYVIMYVCMCGCVCMCVCMYVCMYVCVCVCVCMHRRMRRGAGGCSPPPAFGQLSFLGSGGPFFGQQQWWEGGVFQFSGEQMTSCGQCPRGGGVLVNVQEWRCFSIFRRANDVTQTMSKGGGCL